MFPFSNWTLGGDGLRLGLSVSLMLFSFHFFVALIRFHSSYLVTLVFYTFFAQDLFLPCMLRLFIRPMKNFEFLMGAGI